MKTHANSWIASLLWAVFVIALMGGAVLLTGCGGGAGLGSGGGFKANPVPTPTPIPTPTPRPGDGGPPASPF